MNGDQRFLHNVLDIILAAHHPATIKCTKQRDERAQQGFMSGSVAVEAADHPCSQLAFVRSHSRSRY